MATHKFLIAVDMQNDFIDGALGTKEAVAIVAAAAERIRACRAARDTLIATLDSHDEDYMQTQEGRNPFPTHLVSLTLVEMQWYSAVSRPPTIRFDR